MEVSEVYWEVIQHTANILEICILGCFFYRFVKPFLPVKRNTKSVAVVYIIVMLFLYIIPQEVGGSVSAAISVIAVFILMCFIDKRNIEQKIFLASTFYLLDWLAWGVVVALWNFSYDIIDMVPAANESYLIQFELYAVRQVCWLIIVSLTMEVLIRLLHKAYAYKAENMTKKELVLMMAPTLSLISGRLLFKYFVNVYEMDIKQYVWENHHNYNLVLFLHQIISFAALFTIIIIYGNIKESQRSEIEEKVLARQIEDMKAHISEVEKLYRDIRGMKHDMANHVMVLERLYGDNADSGEYVAQLKEQMNDTVLSVEAKSGNPITDVILMEKEKEAQEWGITFDYDFHYPENKGLNAFDVSVILNNALSNAIEAARERDEPYIRLSSYRKNNAYMIEIRNSMTGTRIMDEGSGLPITTKTDGMHGFGLSNIRKVAQKYYGDIHIEQDGKEFVLTAMLILGEFR